MPSSSEILASLGRIANQASVVAIAWHVVVGLAVVSLIVGFKPNQRTAALLLSVPLASVSLTAWSFGNPFNGAVLAVATLVLAGLASLGATQPARTDQRWALVVGILLVAFAWVYPHFLVERSALAYLYAAPLGILPCPTLALVSGAALCGGGLVGGAWRLSLAGFAAFYALFGMLRLGVLIDGFLLLGAIGLIVQDVQHRVQIRSAANA